MLWISARSVHVYQTRDWLSKDWFLNNAHVWRIGLPRCVKLLKPFLTTRSFRS